jgi:hypothetical protein
VFFFTPAVAKAAFYYINTVPFSSNTYFFWTGFIAYIAAHLAVARHFYARNYLEVLIHELIHGFFAILTCHQITKVHASKRGGYIEFIGAGNWLIAIAPYFFPMMTLATLFFSGVYAFHYQQYNFQLVSTIIGITCAFHIHTILVDTHAEQTDLQLVSWPFTLMFLPGINLFTYFFIYVYADKGIEGAIFFLKTLDYFILFDINKFMWKLG